MPRSADPATAVGQQPGSGTQSSQPARIGKAREAGEWQPRGMGDGTSGRRSVVLRAEHTGNESRHLSAELTAGGDLRLADQDLGPGTADVSSDGDYEWETVVPAEHQAWSQRGAVSSSRRKGPWSSWLRAWTRTSRRDPVVHRNPTSRSGPMMPTPTTRVTMQCTHRPLPVSAPLETFISRQCDERNPPRLADAC